MFNMYKTQTRQRVIDALEKNPVMFSPRDKKILNMRFGIKNGNHYTLAEIGKKFGVTRERIRQIEVRCLKKIQLHETKNKGN